MDKLIYAVWRRESDTAEDLSHSLRTGVAPELIEIGAGAVQVNVSDAMVADAGLRLTTFDAPVDAVVSVWVPDADANAAAVTRRLETVSSALAGWLVSEAVPVEPPAWPEGQRHPGLAQVTFLRRPPEMDRANWLERWQIHTTLASALQDISGLVQNTVVRPVTPHARDVDAVVEELSPIEAVTDAATRTSDDAFGADTDVAVVPTSRYVLGSTYRLPS